MKRLDITGVPDGEPRMVRPIPTGLLIAYYVISTIIWGVYGGISSTVILVSLMFLGVAPFSTAGTILGIFFLVGVIGAIVLGNVIEVSVGRKFNPIYWKQHLILDNALYFGLMLSGVLGVMV